MSATSPLVSIPDCKATQLLGPAQTDLGHGTLLALADPASPDSLLIQVGSAAFALTAASKFYTHVDDARQYYFPADSGEAVGSGSYVQLTLPADVSTAGSETQRLRDTFEDALLARGFLRAGPFAAADELGRSIAQDGTANAAALSSAAQTHIDAADGRDLAVPEVLKDIAVSAKDGTAKVQGYTAAGAEAIGSAAQAAGAKAAAYLPAMPSGGGDSDLAQKARALYADASEAVGTLTSGVADGCVTRLFQLMAAS
jgi:hypothetical protein